MNTITCECKYISKLITTKIRAQIKTYQNFMDKYPLF